MSQSKALRDKGIHCVQTQDYEERHRKGLYGNGDVVTTHSAKSTAPED